MTKLELAVDFDYKQGMVGLRFFERDSDGDRSPLRVQRLYNITVKARRDPSSLDPDFRDLLVKLAPEISKPAVISSNLQILPIPHTTWNRLKNHRAVKKANVRDHSSGASITTDQSPIPLYFELESHGDQTLFSAVLDGPSGSIPWSKVCNDLRQRRIPTLTLPRLATVGRTSTTTLRAINSSGRSMPLRWSARPTLS